MKIIICTTPIRPAPTDYPPFGSMAIVRSLREAGYDPYYYDIDGLRPQWEAVEKFFTEFQPDVVGISGLVSTAYAYTKKLSIMLHRVCPKAQIVVGGNLAASAEILHRLAGVDYTVVGEGEIIIQNLVRYIENHGARRDFEALAGIRGITYLDRDGQMRFTGYETALPATEVFKPDYSILEKYSRIQNYIGDPFIRSDFAQDPRSFEASRRGKKQAVLITAKGCVARCTFCHRWDKGYRAMPVEHIMRMVRYLKEKYNVGFIQFADENFGSDRRQADEFLRAIKKEDILYIVGGVRVRTVDPEFLARLKDSGCVALYYGMETGSPTILEVMEKKASLQDNVNAARWTHEAGLYTIYQLVLAMPEESRKTIAETTEFMKSVTEFLPEHPKNRMSINYIQALPGTPVYEYARYKGLIGRSLKDEEAYLLSISDINAADDTKFLNFTDVDYLTVQSWRRLMVFDIIKNYRVKRGLPRPSLVEFVRYTLLPRLFPNQLWNQQDDKMKSMPEYEKGGYFNMQRNMHYDVIAAYAGPLGRLMIWAWLLSAEFTRLSFAGFMAHVGEFLKVRLGSRKAAGPAKSLRKLMEELAAAPASMTEQAMVPLRAGR